MQKSPLFHDFSRPVIFAHRGACAYAPENTLAAFELAFRQGADAIELDTKLSADGQPVVIHDQTVDRTTAQHGKVSSFTAAQLRQMDAGSYFDITFRGEPIPSLEDVFAALGQRIYINVELTNYASPRDDLPEKVAELVQRHNLEGRVLFSSFNPLALVRVQRRLPDTPVGMLAFPGWKGGWARGWIGRKWVKYHSLHPYFSDVTERLVSGVHRRGGKLFVWTVNQADEMKRLFRLGVDGIFTDDPVLARQTLGLINQPPVGVIQP